MDDNNNMNQPLTGGGGDSMSQTSQQSGSKLSGSLLDRIRAQQERIREHQPASELQQQTQTSQQHQQQQQGQMIVGPATPSHITIPNYGPSSTGAAPGGGGGGGGGALGSSTVSELGSSSFLSPNNNNDDGGGGGGGFGGFGGFSFGGGGGFGGFGSAMGGGGTESLLGQQNNNNNSHQQYSMSEYFHTFVMDVYDLFRKLPVVGQIILILFLLYLVIKWI